MTPEQLAKLKSDPKYADVYSFLETTTNEILDKREASTKKKKAKPTQEPENDIEPPPTETQTSFFDDFFGIFGGTK